MDIPTYVIGTMQTKAYRVLREHVYSVLVQYQLTPSYWSMLGIIIVSPNGIRHSELAKAMHVKPPLITIMARQLEEQGYIRQEKNQFDARAKLLAITPQGKQFVKTVEIKLHKSLLLLLKGVDESDLVSYHKVLATIIENDTLEPLQG